MPYFFVKVGSGNAHAAALLDEQKLGRPMVAGFFRGVSLDEIQRRIDDESVRFSRQAIDMYRWSVGDYTGYGVCVAAGIVWIIEADGPMEEIDGESFERRVGPTTHKDDIPKLVPVRVLYRERVTHVPSLVAQITANRHLSSSTFKEIADGFGTIVSIEHVLFKAGIQHSYPSLTPESRTLFNLLLCLGGNELITLVARILEEHGLSVPAPTGGFVKNIDVIAYNDRYSPVHIDGVVVPPRRNFRSGAVTIQVRGAVQDVYPVRGAEVDYIVQLNAETADGVLNYRWFETALRRTPIARRWLGRVLRWVPFAGYVLQGLSE